MIEAKVPDEVLAAYASGLEPQEHRARAEASKTTQMLAELKGVAIKTQDGFKGYAELLQQVKTTSKFLDEERKISVGPLNVEVKRINGWFKPAIDGCEAVVLIIEKMMNGYLLEKKRQEQALLKKAEDETRRALALQAEQAAAQVAQAALAKAGLADVTPTTTATTTAPVEKPTAVMQNAAALLQEAAAVMPEKVAGVSERPTWKFEVVDASVLERRFLMPNVAAIKAWVLEHGDKDVPAGVKVEAEYKFTVRRAG